MAENDLKDALLELVASAQTIAAKHNVGPVELLTFGAAYGLQQHMPIEAAIKSLAEAWANLQAAGLKTSV